MNRTQNKDHRKGTYEIYKSSLSCFDDKIYIQNNGCYLINYYQLTVILITIQKSFFVKHIVLIFPPVRIDFLSSKLF